MADHHLYPRRELATHYLQLLLDRPHGALSLFGPRQIGKTTFITGDLSALASSRKIQPVYIDLMAAVDKLEAINGALREAAYALKSRRSQERLRGVKALGVGVDFEAAAQAPTSSDPGQQLQHLMADLLRQPGVQRVLLLLDEVQELAQSKDGDATMKAVRAVANKHKADGRVLMLMTGSSREGLARLFAAHGRPSFGLAERQDFPVLGRDYVEYVVHRANEPRSRGHKLKVDEFVEAFGMMDHRPADLEAFVGHVATYNVRDVVGAVPSFLKARYPTDQLEQRYSAMTPLQRILLAHIANGATELTGQSMIRTVVEQLGTSVTPAGVRKALTRLPGDILANPHRGSYVIVDPIFAGWLKSRIS
ncbi:hypothetical protein [Ramlibacter albus]|uniref:ATP-binding protein n=1 Tax=Ramlibacter albus TaxID=2079448 RepID=A0A923S4K4_9BURK|nr:hypothetical protein [Ramlibacter albus]MBC5764227.1 hypothetical protein [Ramlibacter albus]